MPVVYSIKFLTNIGYYNLFKCNSNDLYSNVSSYLTFFFNLLKNRLQIISLKAFPIISYIKYNENKVYIG